MPTERMLRRPRFPMRAVLVGVFGLAALALIAMVLLIVRFERSAGSAVRLGAPAPDFRMPAHDGRIFHQNDYRGRAVFLAFLPSLDGDAVRAEALSLKATMPQFDAAGAKLFLVADTDAAHATRFHDSLKLPFPVLLDRGGALARQFGVLPDRPETVTIDPKGTLRFHIRAVETARHGPQLIEVTKCCIDDVVAARVTGVGKPVADYSLARADGGGMATIYGDRVQKATVALFLSTRCPCSNAYDGRVAQIAGRYGARGVRFVAIYANADETARDIVAHATRQGFQFPALRDDRQLAADHFHASITPQAFVMDAKGVLRYAGRIDDSRQPADVKRHDLTDAIDAVLTGGALPGATPGFGCAIVREPTR